MLMVVIALVFIHLTQNLSDSAVHSHAWAMPASCLRLNPSESEMISAVTKHQQG